MKRPGGETSDDESSVMNRPVMKRPVMKRPHTNHNILLLGETLSLLHKQLVHTFLSHAVYSTL